MEERFYHSIDVEDSAQCMRTRHHSLLSEPPLPGLRIDAFELLLIESEARERLVYELETICSHPLGEMSAPVAAYAAHMHDPHSYGPRRMQGSSTDRVVSTAGMFQLIAYTFGTYTGKHLHAASLISEAFAAETDGTMFARGYERFFPDSHHASKLLAEGATEMLERAVRAYREPGTGERSARMRRFGWRTSAGMLVPERWLGVFAT
jgi:hypothetical protein